VTGHEAELLAVGAVEPAPQLAGELRARERVGVGALGFVRRHVADLAEVVGYVRHLRRQDALLGEAAKGVLEGLTLAEVDRMAGDGELGQKLDELPQFDRCSRGVVAKVAFGKSSKVAKVWVMGAEECKIRGRNHQVEALGSLSAPKPEPLVVGEQGSFTVPGAVVTAPGTFDPLNPLKPDGQTSLR
jgi:hypothetical protein